MNTIGSVFQKLDGWMESFSIEVFASVLKPQWIDQALESTGRRTRRVRKLPASLTMWGIDAVAPVAADELRREPQGFPHSRPGFAEYPGLEYQDAIPRRQAVAQGRLPCPMAVGCVDEGLALAGAKYRLQIVEAGSGEPDELVGVQLDGRSLHRAQHAIGNVRGAW